MPAKADWLAAIRAIPRDETLDRFDLMSPQFVAAGWCICAEHLRNFEWVVLRWAQPDHPPARPELPALATKCSPIERRRAQWLYRVRLTPERLADYIAQEPGGYDADVSQTDVSELLPEEVAETPTPPADGRKSMKLNSNLAKLLKPAFAPCEAFEGPCREMRWNPARGHVPRGFLGATGNLKDIELVLVFAEPGDPHEGEKHEGLESAYDYAAYAFETGKDQSHRNVRAILDYRFTIN